MNTRESDNEQYQWLLERRRGARQGIRWMRIMVYGALVIAVALIWAGRAEAWVSHIDCEGGVVGAKTKEAPFGAFSSSFMRTVYSNEQVSGGSLSCKMGITRGNDGWGEWGGIYMFPTKIAQGSNLWIRLNMYVPTTFNYTGQPWLKFTRVHTASPSNSNQGYLDLYINPLNGTVWDESLRKDVAAPFTYYYEGRPIPHTLGTRPANNIALGKWESYEIHYALDDVPKSKGGTGNIRIWKNNVLLANLSDQVTLADASTYAEGFYLFTYWNGNAPATQSLYVDDIIITTDTPSGRDAAGNPFIGGGTVTPKIDCQVSAYGDWDAPPWSTCTGGNQTRQEMRARTVVTQPSGGGLACPALIETRTVTQACALLVTVGGDVNVAAPNYTTFGWKLGNKVGTVAAGIKCDATRRIPDTDFFRVTSAIVWIGGKKDYVVARCRTPAGTANLRWTPSPSPDVAGYRLLYGTRIDALAQSIDSIPVSPTTLKIEGLVPGSYYFAMQAYTTTGERSPMSSVLSVAVP